MHIANFGFVCLRIVMSLLLISSSQGAVSLFLVSDISKAFSLQNSNPEESGRIRKSPEKSGNRFVQPPGFLSFVVFVQQLWVSCKYC